MDIISRKYINEGFNSKAYIINDDYILLDGVNQNSYKNYQKMEDYLSDTNNSYDNTRLKEFAGEAISLINDCVNTNKIRK